MAIILSSILIFFAFFQFRKQKFNSLSIFLYILYCGSFLSTIVLNIYIKQDILTLPSIYLLLVLLIWIIPFNNIKIIEKAIDNSGRREIKLGIVLCILLIPSTIFYSKELYQLITTTGFHENIRGDLHVQYTSKLGGFLQTMTNFFFVAEFLFFLSLVKKWNKWLILALFVASLSFPISVLSVYGRDGVIFWFFNFLILYFLFKPFYPKKLKKYLKIILIAFFVCILFVLLTISATRFIVEGMGGDTYFISGTLGYFGQQLENFSDIFYFDPEYSGSIFPGFISYYYKFMWITPTNTTTELLIKAGLSEETNVFSTFVSTLYFAYGYIGTIIFSIFIAFLIKFLNDKFQKTYSLYYFMLIFIIYQIPLLGVFYYRQGLSRGDIAYFIGFIILFLIYRIKIPNHISKLSNNQCRQAV